ncbi:MAG: hypothetical protein ACYCX3_01205 [Thermoleophilia bacterium]
MRTFRSFSTRSLDRAMGTRLIPALALAFALSLGLTGCGTDDAASTAATTAVVDPAVTGTTLATPSSTAPLEATTSLATTTTAGATGTEGLSGAETLLSNGNIRAMGFIDQIRFSGTTNYVRIDYAEMLTGDAALAAALEAGAIEAGDDLPNDYYISNVNPQRREFAVSDTVAITTSTWGGVMERPVTWNEFTSFWSSSPPPDSTHLRNSPWWIERQGDTIVKIDEQYLP